MYICTPSRLTHLKTLTHFKSLDVCIVSVVIDSVVFSQMVIMGTKVWYVHSEYW